jgi:hypothetical protein
LRVFTRRLAVATLVASLLAGASACGGGGSAPQALPPLTSSASPAPSPTGSAPGTTSKQAELAAATAVVRRYYALLGTVTTSADPDAFASLMTGNCECRKFVNALRAVNRKNEHYFGTAHIRAIRPVADGPSLVQVLVSYDASKGGIARQNGTVVARSHALRAAALDYRLVRHDERWLIADVAVVDKGDGS